MQLGITNEPAAERAREACLEVVMDRCMMIEHRRFLPDYKEAVNEAYRVLKSNGQLIAMVLNPESEYFKNHVQKGDSYFKRVRHTNLKEIERYFSKFFRINAEYFLGIKDNEVFETSDKSFASLYVIKGLKVK